MTERMNVNRTQLERIYDEALDAWEFRLFGTRSHVSGRELRKALLRRRIMESYRMAAMMRPQSLLFVGSVA